MAYPFPYGAMPFFPPAPVDYSRGRTSSRDRSRSRSRSRDRRTGGSSSNSSSNRGMSQSENRRTGGDSARTAQTIFVSGIHPRVEDMDLFEFFSHAGRVDDIQLIKEPRTGKSKGLAYIEMSSVDEARKASMLNGQLVGGYPITIVMCTPQGPVSNAPSAQAANRPAKPVPSPDSIRLYVGSLHFYITEKDLEPIFEAFGELESVEVHRDSATGQSKGFGFVQFKKKEEGEMAMAALDGYDIAGRNIRVGLANPTDAPGSKNPRPAAQQQQQKRPAMHQQPLQSLFPGAMMPGAMLPGTGLVPGAVPAVPQLPVLSAAQLSPSPCLLISNMFDPATESDPEWALDLDEDVRDETAKYGKLAHLLVDKESSAGRVWMRFEQTDAAQQSQKALHGRWFAGRQLTAEFVTENDYTQRFPESAANASAAPAETADAAAPAADAAAPAS